MILRKTKKPSLPRARVQDRSAQQLLDALTEAHEVGEGQRGNLLDKKLTWRDLQEMGMVRFAQAINNAVDVQPLTPIQDMTIPPAPTGFEVNGAFSVILLKWDGPYSKYRNHARTEVYRAVTNDFGQAVLIGSSTGSMYGDAVGNSAEFYYWVRFVSTSNVPGPINATSGTYGKTGEDPAYLLQVLTGQIKESQLYAALNERINLIDTPITGLIDLVSSPGTGLLDRAGKLENDTIAALLDQADVFEKLLFERAVTDATVDIDPITGVITLKASAVITTDIEARITNAEFRLDGTEGEIDIHTGQITALDTSVSSNTSSISLLQGEVNLKADAAYVDLKTLELEQQIDEEGLSDLKNTSPNGLLWLILSEDQARQRNLINKARVAVADFNLSALADDLGAEAQARLTLAAVVDSNIAAIQTEQTARTTADSALASDITTLATAVDGNAAAIQTEQTARTTADSALASDITTLQTTVGGHTTSIQSQAQSIDGLSAQFTMKIDNNGFMSGWGLASTPQNGTPFSEFYAMADRFAIINPNTNILAVSGITRSAGTATATVTAHGYATNNYVVITGAAQGQYNGSHKITVTGVNTFTFPVTGTPATPATVQEGFSGIKVGSASMPFVVQDNKVVMSNALVTNLTATNFVGGIIVADEVNTETLSAITADLGAVTAGSLNINEKFIVDKFGNTTIRSGTTGARLEVKNNVIKVFDSLGTLRVKMGDLNA